MPAKPPETIPPLPALPLQSGGVDQDSGANLVRWLFPAYIFIILIGFFLLRIPGVMPEGNDLSPDRAVFTAVNAATLTGFQYSIHPTRFFPPGKIILLALTVVGTLFSLIVGGLATKRILRLHWPDRRIYVAAFAAQIFVLIIGAFASGKNSVLGGVFQATAAWGNSGLYIDIPPSATEVYTHVVLLPLALFGGFGLVVVLQILDSLLHGTPLTRHTKVVLQMSAALFLIGFVGCALLQIMDLESLGRQNEAMAATKAAGWGPTLARLWPRILTNASVMSLNARTAGMDIFPDFAFPRPMLFLIMMLMLVGASPGGTGGGVKTTTLYELLTAPARILRGQPLSRATGIAATWLGIYLIALAFFQIMLLWAEPQMPGDRLLFITISALSNVGLSHDMISMTRSSLLLVSAAMFFGRIAPLLILWWMVDTTRDAEIAVG